MVKMPKILNKNIEHERVTIYMSGSLKEFYKNYSEEMGIGISASMVVALKAYMDAQNGLKMAGDMRLLLEQIQKRGVDYR